MLGGIEIIAHGYTHPGTLSGFTPPSPTSDRQVVVSVLREPGRCSTMDGVAIPGLPQAPKADDFADQYPPEAGGLPAIGVSLASLMPSISSQGGDQSAAAPSAQPPTPGRGTSASTLSPRSKGYAQGVTKSGKRRRRHPVAEIKGGWTLEEDARLKQCADKPTLTSLAWAGLFCAVACTP